MKSLFRDGIRGLFPGIFAMVMATGIISIACHLLKFEPVALALFQLNLVVYGVLWILLLARLIFFPSRLSADLTDHARGSGFFTLVASSCVLGSQFVLINGDQKTALYLWLLSLVLWILLIYIYFTAIMVKETKPSLETGINGAWLIIIVATQSVSNLGTLLANSMGAWRERFLFLSLSLYLLGGLLYVLIMAIILTRLFFYPMGTHQMVPTYWISMGAMAISTLAGDSLILNAGQWSFLQELLIFLKGVNLLFWVTATFWIPLLILLGFWRHIIKRYSLRYDPQFWGMVFPMGMYTACTFQLAKALDFPDLFVIPRIFIYFALFAWGAVFAQLIYQLGRNLIAALREPS